MSEDKKNESLTEKKLSRRSMMKWVGALGGGIVIGAGLGYGATQLLKPPPVSLKPPLSADAQQRVNAIVKGLVDRHSGEDIVYNSCRANCGATSQCIMKARVKNGVVTAIEPDDSFHQNVGREDEVMKPEDFDKARFQRRGCAILYNWLNQIYSPNRIIYPMKRAPGAQRGEGKFVRISWDQALNEVTGYMKQARDKYGPFFLLAPYSHNPAFARFCGLWGAGCTGMGACSDDTGRIMQPFMGVGSNSFGPTHDLPDNLKYTKLNIHLGLTNATTHFAAGYSGAWYRRLARERGTPTIIIDPKYTWDVEMYADQWIPIKPGTDAALLMGMANVILKEGLYDKAWVDKWMVGFQQQSDYILGKGGKGVGDYDPQYTQYDTIDKTPEWAEKICGIPAETIRELARLYAKTKPAVLGRHAAVTRKSYGEYVLRLTTFLSVLTSNCPYVHGGSDGSSFVGNAPFPRIMGTLPGVLPGGGEMGLSAGLGGYAAPTFYRSFQWWKAVFYSDMVQNKQMTWDKWATLVGFNAYPPFKSMFNPKMLWMGSNHSHGANFLVMAENTNMQIKALQRMELIIQAHSKMNATVKYSDIVFPMTDWAMEIPWFTVSAYGGFGNMVYLSGPSKKVPGECKTIAQFYANIAERVGGMDLAKQWFKYYTGDQNWDKDWMTFLKDSWEQFTVPWLKTKGVTTIPSFDDVKAAKSGPVINYRVEEYLKDTWCGEGVKIDSASGKVEIYNADLADPSTRGKQHYDHTGVAYGHMPNDWKDLQPISVYHPCVNGMEDAKTKQYPLMLLSPHSRFRIHYLFNDEKCAMECYRHSVIMSTADAKARGIKDGDMVRIWNDQGQGALPAYVTSRMMPGVVQMRTGVDFILTASGLDIGGNVNQFTGGDDISPVTPSKVTNLVEVEKYLPGEAF